MNNASSPPYGPFYDCFVGVLLPFHLQIGGYRYRIQPEITVCALIGIIMKIYALNFLESLSVKLGDMLMMTDMLVYNRHLPTSNARTDITHAIVITDFRMLIVRI